MADVCFAVRPYVYCDTDVVSVAGDEQAEAFSEGIAGRCINQSLSIPCTRSMQCKTAEGQLISLRVHVAGYSSLKKFKVCSY